MDTEKFQDKPFASLRPEMEWHSSVQVLKREEVLRLRLKAREPGRPLMQVLESKGCRSHCSEESAALLQGRRRKRFQLASVSSFFVLCSSCFS